MKASLRTCAYCRLLLFSFLLCVVIVSGQEGKIFIDNVNTNLKTFIELVAKETNKQILYDTSILDKKIYLVSSQPVTKDELYKIFLSVMEYHGFILEEAGIPGTGSEIIKIKRNIQGPWTPTRTIYDQAELDKTGKFDNFITMVIKLKYISAREVQTTLRALRIVNPQGGNLAGIEGSNTILITDFATNVKRIYDVIRLMDEEGPSKEFKVIRLQHAIAEDVAEKLKEFAADKNKPAGGFGVGPNLDELKIIADKRLNALVIQAYSAKMDQVNKLVAELDQKLDEEPTTIHYVRLKHADATKLEETLSKLIESGGFAKSNEKKSAAVTSSQPDEEIPIAIKAEPQTNSLLVRADEHRWKEIAKIIDQVDVRRPQVLIEAALLELSAENTLGLGVEVFWAESPQKDRVTFSGGDGFGFSNLVSVKGDTATPVDASKQVSGTRYGKVPNTAAGDPFDQGILGLLNYGGDDKSLFNIPLLFRAIEKQGDFKILSLPSVLTNDNEKAEVKVTDKAPTKTTSQGSGGSNSISGFGGYQEAGTILLITPHISGEKNYLRLELEQTIDQFDRSVLVDEVPGVKSRKITTSLTVPDGQTVAIGGLTYDKEEENIRKIPLLGDLPLLGFLFETRVVIHKKVNIYLFVTPRILREKSFEDLLQYSHDIKMDAEKYGVDMNAVDKSFVNYQKKYGFKAGQLPPLYMLEYKSPAPQSNPSNETDK